MSFLIRGLDPGLFRHLVGAADGALAERQVERRIADAKPGFPCRISLEDADPGDSLLLLNHESHAAPTPYRSAYAIFINEKSREAAVYRDEIPPVMRSRPIALRHFSAEGRLVGASLALKGDSREAILAAFGDDRVAYIHAHNAAHGCFAAEVLRD
ncbi:MAG: DUF1203 domain-containing protein [Parvularculaceae bacterium]|nr:DUF1203 domain-containing protein [Parvularculaceae bacterium]